MADHDIQMEDIEAGGLRKLPDQRLNEVEFDSQGTVYDDLFQELQIRPESCQEFLRMNLRPFRNKFKHRDLIAKGDPDSLKKLSESFIRAFGNLVWAKDRRWLLRSDELGDGEEALQYVPPKNRQQAEHAKFFNVLERLWKRMRNTIFMIKPAYLSRNNNTLASEDAATDNPSHKFSSIEPPSPHSDDDPDSQSSTSTSTPAATMARKSNKKKATKQQPADRTAPRLGAPPPLPNEIAPRGFWPASRTQEAIMNIIVDLHTTRMNSHPKIFTQAYDESMARLDEWIEEDRLAELAGEDVDAIPHPMANKTQAGSATHSSDTPVTNPNTTTNAKPSLPTHQPSPADHTQQPKSFTDAHRPTTPPRHPLSTYSPPVLPVSMSLFISPFIAQPSSSNVQPYLWTTAPMLPTSYPSFIEGLRERANVPDCVKSSKLTVVLAYGWNDFSRVVRNEEDWRNGVMADLGDASVRLGVRVWRGRCCVVAV